MCIQLTLGAFWTYLSALQVSASTVLAGLKTMRNARALSNMFTGAVGYIGSYELVVEAKIAVSVTELTQLPRTSFITGSIRTVIHSIRISDLLHTSEATEMCDLLQHQLYLCHRRD